MNIIFNLLFNFIKSSNDVTNPKNIINNNFLHKKRPIFHNINTSEKLLENFNTSICINNMENLATKKLKMNNNIDLNKNLKNKKEKFHLDKKNLDNKFKYDDNIDDINILIDKTLLNMNDNLNDLVDFCESILNEDNIMYKNITNCSLQNNEFNKYETTDSKNFEILNNLEKNKNKIFFEIENKDTKKLISSEIPTELIDINFKLYYNQTIKDNYKSNLTDINENSDTKEANTTIT
ncbi:hypothetical protein NAPIS_ORF00648 [Vairimorpha apis BRL 01]|uniref:Uncharacterized protein n=1 Tax=Vairimorpha apis BRL 01 TaxID=1037528 RepID=T0LBW5_9MICR|nr:hypothetical protein NAPIS_ORF00648 [Vairimorpha apis BRL 01]